MRKLLMGITALLVIALEISCGSRKISSAEKQEEARQKASLLAAKPGDLVEFKDGMIERVGYFRPLDSFVFGVEMRLDYPGMPTQGTTHVHPAHVKQVYHQNGEIFFWPSVYAHPRNPEQEAWKEAATRYVLQGVQPQRVASKH